MTTEPENVATAAPPPRSRLTAFFNHAERIIAPLWRSPAAGDWFLAAVTAALLFAMWRVIFGAPTLLEVDSYYHVGVTNILLKHGFINEFEWTQFSLMKNFYADKDLLLHLFIMPFAYFLHNPIMAGKVALAALELGALGALGLLFRKYAGGFAAGLLLLLMFSSSVFNIYFMYLRPGTLAAVFTVAGLYFMAEKRHWAVFIVAVLFSLAHISAFTLVYFALLCEAVRWLREREFYTRNPVFAAAGLVLGLLIHPNFPNNMLTIYVNAFLTPYYASVDKSINFAGELNPNNTKRALYENFPIAVGLAALVLTGFWQKFRLSTATAIYLCATGTYIVLAAGSNRFWFAAVPLMIMALASLTRDWRSSNAETTPAERLNIAILSALALFALVPVLRYGHAYLERSMTWQKNYNAEHEKAALWMKEHLPPNETVFHPNWADSPHFICLNPKNRYIAVLDPIYTYYWSRQAQHLMQSLEQGTHPDPYTEIKETFKARYVFSMKTNNLYKQLLDDKRFRPLYFGPKSAIFELLSSTAAVKGN